MSTEDAKRAVDKLARLYNTQAIRADEFSYNAILQLMSSGEDSWDAVLNAIPIELLEILVAYTRSERGRNSSSAVNVFRPPGASDSEFELRRAQLAATYQKLSEKIVGVVKADITAL